MECLNCHTEFIGNYCPSCGQPASTQRFTVKKALMATLEVWGMGNRSLPRTVLHLIYRPGQMIGEYLDGKRMPFFPPVKMLFVLCIFFAVESSLLGEKTISEQITSSMNDEALKKNLTENTNNTVVNFNGKKISTEEMMMTVKDIVVWMDQHKAVELICLHSFFMLFAWMVFRKSPTRPKSTMAEHFFTQVFMSGQMMALSIIYLPLFSSGKEDYAFYPLPWWLLFALFVWDYKYIFGYKWKTTIRKVIVIHFLSIVLFISIAGIIAGLLMAYAEGSTVAK
ncbi:MAG: DUF3667 domain-containing protein [Prevotella sp.]|nr:DUF3667 domain-containing protein [Prevotellaceae bacterium]MDY5344034.1 DUF3667 domain-containing protein [Prevotella sp.]